MPRQLLVFGHKTFRITLPDGARVTFGPWSPPHAKNPDRYEAESRKGTLRIYDGAGTQNILACFSGVNGFRDLTLPYAEEVAREEGAVIWKDDEQGYMREHKSSTRRDWITPDVHVLPEPAPKGKRR